MASFPPSDCCYRGFKHEGPAKGSLSQLADFEVYTTHPQNQSMQKGILM